MGGNDLNLKKSWHPQLMTNQRRVYDAEQAALQERKLTEARLEEIRRERQIEETQKQLEAAGGQKKVDRVEWMYQGPNDGGRDEYSSEAFLLGKRRIDSVLRGDDMKKVEKTAGPTGETPAPLPVIASARDTAAKIREDPLVAIKRQEQGAYQAMMKDPSKRRQLLAQMGIIEEKPKSKHREHREHRHRSHRSHRHRDDDPEQERRHRRRREDSRDRSRSPRRYDDDSEPERRRKRRRSDSRDRSPTTRRDDHDSGNGRRHKSSRSDSREGSRPQRRHNSDEENEGRAPRREYSDRRRHDSEDRREVRERRHSPRRKPSQRDLNGGGGRRSDDRDDEEERARKLAAMQSDATDLDRARESRLAALAEKEQADREADDRARANSSKYGGREFAHKLHNAAGNGSLADRIGRGRQGFQREDD
ncbi:RNA-splicing factor [Diaporthe australafricana]|uniref:RNA-splicing factor n=1 Tax=Diaporthe australafricana TaxID=127596 RepID=A0ABR3VXF0_9PEZI